MTYTFTGPRGQFVTFREGRAWTRGLTPSEGGDLWEATEKSWPATPTGPWLGGDGLRDRVSVYLACRHLWPTWEETGTPPEMNVPGTTSTDIVA